MTYIKTANTQLRDKYAAVIIGGGFFGCKLAIYLKSYLDDVLIIEKDRDLMLRASYVNQARVHNGYHYPRSLLTALRSRVSFPKFVDEYKDCIVDDFEKYYAIAKLFSKVNSYQFKLFCERIGVPIEVASDSIKKLFNSSLIEEVFWTREYAFDSVKLKQRISQELEDNKIDLQMEAMVIKVEKSSETEGNKVYFEKEDNLNFTQARYIFNCTYAGLNSVLANSNLSPVPLKHELTEMALVEVPEEIKKVGITVMCGPFFSIMPFPPRQLHTLSHVRYTPHCYWHDNQNIVNQTEQIYQQTRRRSNYPFMIRDATRYVPILQECQYRDSLWDVKTTLPQSEADDSRPILFKKHSDCQNLFSILGSKIDNIYDLETEIFQEFNLLKSA